MLVEPLDEASLEGMSPLPLPLPLPLDCLRPIAIVVVFFFRDDAVDSISALFLFYVGRSKSFDILVSYIAG